MMKRKMARASIKRRLLELGLVKESCSRCSVAEWRGKLLTIHLDHINGLKDDWRLENLRMLCPNCHSQTPTFSGKNRRQR
ncbi:MAG: HNH endonuclease [Candidatus Eremiobacteraeota bacterium]|nr:HNH endonuclease [Candidatus Eremiobacteraeota bacterium]